MLLLHVMMTVLSQCCCNTTWTLHVDVVAVVSAPLHVCVFNAFEMLPCFLFCGHANHQALRFSMMSFVVGRFWNSTKLFVLDSTGPEAHRPLTEWWPSGVYYEFGFCLTIGKLHFACFVLAKYCCGAWTTRLCFYAICEMFVVATWKVHVLQSEAVSIKISVF